MKKTINIISKPGENYCNYSSEIFRLNLEEGKFLAPLITSSSSLTCCEFNSDHHLFICGTNDGRIEAWDHRDGNRCGILDCALHFQANNRQFQAFRSSSLLYSNLDFVLH